MIPLQKIGAESNDFFFFNFGEKAERGDDECRIKNAKSETVG